ncbi:hypothetical protein AFLA_006621 [Aspergillus flavus NRRL3357]|nr:hypothetical protein AFLA_006621 [Aspergillus flavus NRRL3357]
MVALIGPPPTAFVRRSETTEQCFDSSGGWVAHQEATIPTVSLEVLEKRLNGKEKELFLAFIMSMLKWLPEERKTAKQLLEHPFLPPLTSCKVSDIVEIAFSYITARESSKPYSR